MNRMWSHKEPGLCSIGRSESTIISITLEREFLIGQLLWAQGSSASPAGWNGESPHGRNHGESLSSLRIRGRFPNECGTLFPHSPYKQLLLTIYTVAVLVLTQGWGIDAYPERMNLGEDTITKSPNLTDSPEPFLHQGISSPGFFYTKVFLRQSLSSPRFPFTTVFFFSQK